jgi:hypothetical protein
MYADNIHRRSPGTSEPRVLKMTRNRRVGHRKYKNERRDIMEPVWWRTYNG